MTDTEGITEQALTNEYLEALKPIDTLYWAARKPIDDAHVALLDEIGDKFREDMAPLNAAKAAAYRTIFVDYQAKLKRLRPSGVSKPRDAE